MSKRERLGLACGVALLTVGLGALARSVLGDPYWRTSIDFGLYLRAAKELAAGGSAYFVNDNPGLHFGTLARDGYAYPPALAWVVAALLPLGDVAARAVVTVASIAALGWSIVALLRGRLAWPWIVLALGVAAFSRAFRVEAYHGQVNWILLAAIVYGIREYDRGAPMRAGLAWGLTIAVKPFLLVLPAWLAWRRRYREAAASLAVGLGVVAASFAASPESLAGFADSLAYYSAADGAGGRPDNIALHGLWLRLFAPNPYAVVWLDAPWLVRVLDVAGAVSLALLFARSFPRDGEPRTELEVGSVVLAACALGPLSNGSHVWLALPGLVGAWLVSREGEGRAQWVWYGWAAFFALRLLPVRAPWFPDGAAWDPSSSIAALIAAWQAFAMVGLVVIAGSKRELVSAVQLKRAA